MASLPKEQLDEPRCVNPLPSRSSWRRPSSLSRRSALVRAAVIGRRRALLGAHDPDACAAGASIAPALVANAPGRNALGARKLAVILGGFSFFVQGFLFLYALVITLVTLTDIESRNSAFHRIFGGVRVA